MNLTSQNMFYRLLIEVQKLGFSPEVICEKAQITFESLGSGQLTLTDKQAEIVWAESVKETKNNELGFYLGLKTPIEGLATLGFILQNSPTFYEALKNAVSHINLITDVIELSLKKESNEFLLLVIPNPLYTINSPERSKQVSLLTISMTLKIYYHLTLQEFPPVAIYFPYAPPQKTIRESTRATAHQHTKKHYIIKGNIKSLDIKIVNSNPNILMSLINYSKDFLTQKDNKWSLKIEQHLLSEYTKSFPNLITVANSFNLSERSLQRKLKSEDNTFTKILKKVKLNLAYVELKKSKNLKTIAANLGFSSSSSFIKFFKKLTGKTPSSYH